MQLFLRVYILFFIKILHGVLQLLLYPRNLRLHVSAAQLVEEVLMEDGDDATLTTAMFVGGEAVVGSVRLGHAPAACTRHGAIMRGVNGAILGADEAIGERWERMVAARLDDGDGGRLSGALLGVPALALCAMLGHLQVNIKYLKFEVVLVNWGPLGSKNAGDEGGGRGSGTGA